MSSQPEGLSSSPLVQQYQAIQEVLESVVTNQDLSSLFQDLGDRLRPLTRYDAIFLVLYDQATDRMQLRLFNTSIPSVPSISWPLDTNPVDEVPSGLVWKTQQPMSIDIERESRFPKIMDLFRRHGFKFCHFLPLTSARSRLGTLAFVSTREPPSSDEEFAFLRQITRQVAVAVENALNFESAREAHRMLLRERDRLRLLLEVNNAVASNLELRELLNSISVCLHRVIHHDAAALTVYDEESGQLRLFALDRMRMVAAPFEEGVLIPTDDNPTGLAYTTRAPVLVSHLDFEKFPSPLVQKAFKGGIRSGCTAPLISHDKVLGVLSVVSTREAAFTEEDAELLTQVGKQIAIAVENALAFREIESLKDKLADEKLYLEEEIQSAYNFEQIIGQSPGLKQVLRQVETAAPTDSTILVLGETGTGKELIARAIHSLSERRERTMVKINCAAIPTGLLESELFGHEKGAFTGAISQRIGRFELANRGSLFLDEVGDIPLELQPKLLRVLQEQEFERLGSAKTIRVDVRLIAATNSDLSQMVAEKRFRSDLYYRLNVFPIHIPPLRERPEDIPLLVRFFAQTFARRMRKRIETISAESVSALTRYSWPGNIRELQNFIERAVILSKGPALDIPLSEIEAPSKSEPANGSPHATLEHTTLEEAEREHILRVLRETDWVVGGASGAAARLGLKRTTLQSRMRRLGINRST